MLTGTRESRWLLPSHLYANHLSGEQAIWRDAVTTDQVGVAR
jgi:hypothetical protein